MTTRETIASCATVTIVMILTVALGCAIYTDVKARKIADRMPADAETLKQFSAVLVGKKFCQLKIPYIADRVISLYSEMHKDELEKYEKDADKEFVGNGFAIVLMSSIGCPLFQKIIDYKTLELKL